MTPIIALLHTLFMHASIALLSGYLSVSATLASGVTQVLAFFDPPSNHLVVEQQTGSSTFPILPTQYPEKGRIPRILIENAAYQQAAALSALKTTPPVSPSNVVDALVNIFCTYKDGRALHATTGSGVFIDPKGVILTNAHVAQFLLLNKTEARATCTARQGNPAEEKYEVDVLYISPAWIRENAKLIDAESPSGTGERDYALLYVTKATVGTLPDSFPYLSFSTAFLTRGSAPSSVTAAGYPANIFSTEGPRAKLIPRIATTSISNIYTFAKDTADVIALSESSVGEHGSSGGPVISPEGEVMGLIVTRGNAKDGEHSLRALTLPYINKTIKEETGFGLSTTLEGNISRRAGILKEAVIPFLTSLLEKELR